MEENKKNQMLLILKSGIAGFQYHRKTEPGLQQEIMDQLKPGAELILRRDAQNRYDKWAVGIYVKENLIGYISRYKNEAIARMLDSGVRLVAYMDEKEYCLPEMEECSVNEYLKGEIDALYQICDQLQELYENGEKKEHKIRDILTFDLERFMMFLTASDGVISWQEAELFEIYLGHSLTPKKIHC